MEAKWGVGRLELLVDDELRLRFRRQLEKFNEAIEQHEINRVRRHGAGMHKAWSTLDQAATFAGAAPLDPLVWEVAGADGRVIGVTRSNADAFSATRSGRWVEVWTLEELARVVDAWPEIGRTKQTFPGAKIVRVRSKRPINWSQGDDLPFC